MKKTEKYISDLEDIKDIMNRSSKFISLSGLSGIVAGLMALIGAYFAFNIIYANPDFKGYERVLAGRDEIGQLILIALLILFFSVSSGIFFTAKKTKKNRQNIWDTQTKRLLINLFIPLITGGIFCLILLWRGVVGIVAPLTLIFYGLALINASKYTLNEVRSLGYLEILLGLISAYFIGYGLFFWAIGFGVLHIVYGVVMHFKYGS